MDEWQEEMDHGVAWPSQLGAGVLPLNTDDFMDTIRQGYPVSMLDQSKNKSTPKSHLLKQKQEYYGNHKNGPMSLILTNIIDGCCFSSYELVSQSSG